MWGHVHNSLIFCIQHESFKFKVVCTVLNQNVDINLIKNKIPTGWKKEKKSTMSLISIHDGVKCNQCESTFNSKPALKYHKMSKHDGVNFPCNQCDSTFSSNNGLKKHKISVHEGVKYSCN